VIEKEGRIKKNVNETKMSIELCLLVGIEDQDNWHGKPLGGKASDAIQALKESLAGGDHNLTPLTPEVKAPEINVSNIRLADPPNYKVGDMVWPMSMSCLSHCISVLWWTTVYCMNECLLMRGVHLNHSTPDGMLIACSPVVRLINKWGIIS
jgi:hypothetical protein